MIEITYNSIAIVNFLGVIQGVLLGTMICFIYAKKNNALLYLGFFTITFSLAIIPEIIEDLNLLTSYPRLLFLPLDCYYLILPFLYIYIQKISILEHEKKSWWTLFPGIFEVFIGLIIFFQPVEVKHKIEIGILYDIYKMFGLIYSLYIAFLILKWIKAHTREVNNQYSENQNNQLRWTKWFVIVALGYLLITLILVPILIIFFDTSEIETFFNNPENPLYIIDALIYVGLIYWVSIKGIMQPNIASLTSIKEKNDITVSEKNNPVIKTNEYVRNPEKENQTYITFNQIDVYIKNSKIYTKPDLTIMDVAEAIKIHPKRVSGTINSILGKNFNNYINEFRVDLAQILLKDKSYNNLSIDGIGLEVGFHSKSTFYSAFKKRTGITPAKYRC